MIAMQYFSLGIENLSSMSNVCLNNLHVLIFLSCILLDHVLIYLWYFMILFLLSKSILFCKIVYIFFHFHTSWGSVHIFLNLFCILVISGSPNITDIGDFDARCWLYFTILVATSSLGVSSSSCRVLSLLMDTQV